jgi:Protein of unknown function (DUF1524)
LRDKSAALWDDVLTQGAEVVDDFLMAYYTSLTGKRAKRAALFDDFTELLFPPTGEPQSILNALQRMATELSAFMAIHGGQWPYSVNERSQQVAEWQRARLHRLILTLRHELSVPLLLAARARCTEDKFAEIVQMLEIFAFRYKNVCGAHAGPAGSAYYAECRHLRDIQAPVDFSKLASSLRDLLAKRASDTIFSNAIADQLSYDAGSAAKANIRHMLTTLEDYQPWIKQGAAGSPTPSMISITDLNQVTIEHIYAQGSQPPDPTMAANMNRLGNLSYWGPSDNSTAGNVSFLAKKAAYAASSVTLNHDLAVLPAWNMIALTKREKQLIGEACLIWQV